MCKFKMYSYFIVLVFLFGLYSCESEIDIPGGSNSDESMVYMPRAVDVPNRITLEMADYIQSFEYSVYVGGYDENNLDIDVSFGVDPDLVDTFNARYNNNYDILPEGAYSFDNSTHISKGKFGSETMTISINPVGANLTLFKNYLLPLSITEVSNGAKINEDLKIAFFVVQPSLDFEDFPVYDRTDWEITGFSTEEPAEGAPNGLATAILDGDNNTFWHSQWAGALPPMPHWIAIDLGESQEIHGLGIVARQNGTNSGKPKDVTIEVSDDGQNWESAGNLVLEDVVTEQKVFLDTPFKTARYLKFTITSSHGDQDYTHLAELNIF